MIEPSLIKFLPADAAQRLKALESTFESEGFEILLGFLQSKYELETRNILMAKDWPTNRIATGRLSAFGDLVNIQESTANEFTQMAEAGRDEAEVEAEDAELDYE